MSPPLVLLGPQRLRPIVAEVVDGLEIAGKIATVTAGWQEREAEDDELADHLGGRTVNLRLHRRAEKVFAADPELAAAHRERQKRLRELRELYRLRLGHALDATRELLQREGDGEFLATERESAFAAVRKLDEEHLERIRQVHRRFEEEVDPWEREAVRRHRQEIAEILEGVEALAVAGGHVVVLVNRLRMFDLAGLIGRRTVLAWSAGAMALSERLVVFHDTPPQGAGNAEVLEQGLGLYPGVIAFPHARRRLRLADSERVALLSRRFAPHGCLLLDEGDRLDRKGASWSSPHEVRTLGADGHVVVHAAGSEVLFGRG